MFRRRPHQFLSSLTLNSHQIRCKSVKRQYKGNQPRQKPKPKPPQVENKPQNEVKPETKTIPPKKPRDPLQGMRESNEEAKLIKYPPPPKPAPTYTEPSPAPDPEPTTPAESEEDSSPEIERPAVSYPGGRPIPMGQESFFSRKWMYYAMAAIFGAGGLYLFFSKPKAIPTANNGQPLSDPSTPPSENFVKAIKVLQEIFRERCSTNEEDLHEFGGEGIMGIGSGGKPRAVVFPENTAEVEVILKMADTFNIPVIPYSGGTSLEGQCVPTTEAITISLSKMNKIIALRPNDMDITVQPGISWNDLNDFLKPYKLFLPVDPGPNAHIGGMVATSASGTNAVRYGTMKDWVLDLKVVLPGGYAMKTRNRARKSSTGYDLTRLFCGSEGTLGVITEVTLKLAHLPEKEVVGAIAFESNGAAASAVSNLMASGVDPRCVELLDTTCIAAVNNSISSSIPAFPLKPHIFFKLAGSANAVPQQQKTLTSVLTKAGGSKLRIARNEKEGEELWSIRKTLVLSLLAMFPGSEVISTDVCVPLSKLTGLIEQYKKDQDRINAEIETYDGSEEPKKLSSLIMGHVGDGNFHSLIAFEKGNAELKKKAQELENSLVMNALALDGTSSGEHGIGIHKLEFMRSEYDPTALTLMRAIKSGIDPKGIMNPGTLLPPPAPTNLPPIRSTIDTGSVEDWIVESGVLSPPAEADEQLKSVVEGNAIKGQSNYIMSELKKAGNGLASVVGLRKEEPKPQPVSQVPILQYQERKEQGWKEKGDGA